VSYNVVQIVPVIPKDSTAFEFVKGLTTAQLKRAWDEWADEAGGINTCGNDPGAFVCEAVHVEMNARGEGRYVAI